MNISQLRTFAAVVEHGSFSEAARALGISQPAVTMQIQALEADVGATLLDRRYRRVDLTEAGRTLLPHARRVLADVEQAREEIGSLSGTVSGHLLVAASTTPGVYVLPRTLGGFLATYPEVRVTITIHDSSEVVEAVEAGRVHMGVTGAIVRGSHITFEEVGTDELVVICPLDSPFAASRGVTFADLADAGWVMREQGSGTRLVAEQVLAENGVDAHELRVLAELGTGEAAVSAVEGGLGVAMTSLYVAEKALALGTVARVDLAASPITRPFFSAMPKGTPTRAAEAFHSYLKLTSRLRQGQ